MKKKRLPLDDRRALLMLLAIAAAVRLIHALSMADSPLFLAPTSDAFEHYTVATTLAGGDWLGRSIGAYHRPQLFAHFCAVIYWLVGPHFVAIHAVQNALDIAAVGIWFLLARRCFPRVPAFLGGLFVALHWPFVYFASSGYMETFAMFLNGGFLLALAETGRRVLASRHRSSRSPWPMLVLAGILGGLSALTRPTVLIVMPGVGIALLWLYRHARARHWFFPPAAFTVIVTAVVGITALRHWALLGIWAPLGTGSELNFHMGNRIDGWGWDVSSPGLEYEIYQNLPMVEANAPPDVEAVRAWWRARNARYLGEEPGGFAKGLLLKAARLVNRGEIHCTQDFQYARGESPVLRMLPGLGFFGAFALAGIGATFALLVLAVIKRTAPNGHSTSRLWGRLLLLLWVVPYFVGVVIYLDISRHRLPLVPPVLLLGGWALWKLSWVALNRRAMFPLWLAGVIAGAIVCRLPVVPVDYYDKHERWWTQVNLGVALGALNQPAEAEAHFKAAAALYPEKLESHRQLALTRARLGDFPGAIDAQKQLLMQFRLQYPRFYMVEARIFETLALLQSSAGEHADAEQTAHKLVALVPDAGPGYALLARVLEAAGKRDEALAGWEKAVELDPSLRPELERFRETP